jgi:SAM-dependent methyltransferase
MAHKEQWVFCGKVKGLHPEYFENKKVLDIGSFDVNGNNRFLFKDCDFIGLDIGEGDGVDVVCPAQEYNVPDETFDTIISCECWEHNPFYKESIQNAVRILKNGGLFFFTCATIGREVHGVSYLEEQCSSQYDNWKTLPNVEKENWDNDYYKNVTEDDIRSFIDADNIFSSYEFEIEENHCDLYFWGIKK